MKDLASRIRALPLAIRIPVLVAGLAIAVGALASWVVLHALVANQQEHMRELARTALEGLAVSLSEAVARKDIWETFDALDRLVHRRSALPVRTALVLLADGRVLASSDPRRFPTLARPRPGDWLSDGAAGAFPRFDDRRARAAFAYPLGGEGGTSGLLLAEMETAAFLRQRSRALWLLIISNGLLTVILAAGGYVMVQRMLRPLARLTEAARALEAGRVPRLSAEEGDAAEFRPLFAQFEAMAQAVREREVLLRKLAHEEHLAQLGRLASGMAHEVNNPIAGLLTVVDTLRRRGDREGVRKEALDLLERGLIGIANVVRSMLVAYKESAEPAPLSRSALDDLQILVRHEVARKRLRLHWNNRLRGTLSTDASSIRQAVLNLLLNACRATPTGGTVRFDAEVIDDCLRIEISDEGPGMPDVYRRILLGEMEHPPHGRGLGVWTAARLWSRLGGKIQVAPAFPTGTRITLLLSVPSSKEENDAVLTATDCDH